MVRALQTHLYSLHGTTTKTKTELSLSLAPSVPFSVSDETPSPASCLDRKVTYSLPNTAIFTDCLPSSHLQQPANPSAIHSCHFRKSHSTRAFSPTPTPTCWTIPRLLPGHQQGPLHRNLFTLPSSKSALHPRSPHTKRTNRSLRQRGPPILVTEIVFYSGSKPFVVLMFVTRTCGPRRSDM